MKVYSISLANYIEAHFVLLYRGEYVGIDGHPSIDKLLNLQALVEMAIEEKRKEVG